MKVVSLNIGQAKAYDWRGGTKSGILKQAVADSLYLDSTGFEGDEQVDLVHHSGADKAALVMPAINYHMFDVEEPFGYLGENLTIEGLDETLVGIGDQLRIGDVVLEVTQPRSPCWKLNALSGRTDLLNRYAQSGHVGFYCRVLQPGKVCAGDAIRHIPDEISPGLAIKRLFLAKYHHQTPEEFALITQAINHPKLSADWRKELQQLLDKLQRRTSND